ncbi:unnamed protein product [Brugia timori]|uniref:Transposase n=1 Tax=Brugia timori TaxID=42155 RepID=A0A0R3RBH9_9BILA|nr:unnamed protein product [Brugia timori]
MIIFIGSRINSIEHGEAVVIAPPMKRRAPPSEPKGLVALDMTEVIVRFYR